MPQVPTLRRPLVLASVITAMFIIAIEATIVSIAMPQIAGHLGDLHLYSWVFSSFLLTQTATLVRSIRLHQHGFLTWRMRAMRLRTMLARAGLLAALVASVLPAPAVAQQTLRVGATPTGMPFTFLDTKTNTIQGMMVDLITAIGQENGLAVEIQPMQFSTLVPALTTNKLDAVSAAMLITPVRQQVIDFSTPVYTYGEGLVVPAADKRDIVDAKELAGGTVGAQVGTAYVEPLTKLGVFADVKVYDTSPDILRDVAAGRLQGGFADFPIVAYAIGQGNYPGLRLVRSYKPMVVGSVGIAVRKDEPELLAKINASLERMRGDGRLQAILTKWGL